VADEERTERLQYCEVSRLPHRRTRWTAVQLAADEADDEIVVVDVEAVAGQADVVGEVRVAVGAAQDAVLADDRALLLGREPAEGAGAA